MLEDSVALTKSTFGCKIKSSVVKKKMVCSQVLGGALVRGLPGSLRSPGRPGLDSWLALKDEGLPVVSVTQEVDTGGLGPSKAAFKLI